MAINKRTAADVPTTRVIGMAPVPPYGMELVADLHDCNHTLFTRLGLTEFFELFCALLDMKRGPLHFWDYKGADRMKSRAPPHLKGTTAVQFIYTSNITVHTLDDLRRVYLNVFSCREFDAHRALGFCNQYFGAGWSGHRVFERS